MDASYVLSVSDYRSIDNAEIKLDGITVLAGINSSGKSTVARLLYNIIRGANEFDAIIDNDTKMKENELIEKLSRALTSFHSSKAVQLSSQLKGSFTNIGYSEIPILSARLKYDLKIVDSFIDICKDYVQHSKIPYEIPRIQSLLGLKKKDSESMGEYLEALKVKLSDEFIHIYKVGESKKESRRLMDFYDAIRHYPNSSDIDRCKFELSEDGVQLITQDKVRLPLNLERAIYYDTTALSSVHTLALFDESDLGRLVYLRNKEIPKSGIVIKSMMEAIMDGRADLDKDNESLFGNETLNFHRADGLVFPLQEAATGIISMSYIYRLLVNGWLDSGTLLIIDEPEAHLHPQWIVEFARILVLLQKRLGMKILISTHNPDMVSAIRSIASREEILPSTRFYLAERSESKPYKFNYKDIGHEIAEIFESFNMAFSRIAMYGDEQ